MTKEQIELFKKMTDEEKAKYLQDLIIESMKGENNNGL